MPIFDVDADSIERPTILGSQRTNPYTISNMQHAYGNLGLTGITVNVTNLYVRFLPNSAQQLSTLDSIMDAQGLELFDTPMDYDVLQEGDYYQDPYIPDTSVTYQYAVVPANFQFPSGVTHLTLAQIHIPGDSYTEVETEAERLASIQDSIFCMGGGIQKNRPEQPDTQGYTDRRIIPNVVPQQCDPGYHWDDNLRRCVADGNCPAGYYWESITQTCIPLQNPPQPSPDAQVPAGSITVSDVNLNSTPGVRNVRIVAKRWFKVERTYTDNNGHFQLTKHFKHKVKINVKFRNDNASIKTIRGIRLWQMVLSVTHTIGVFSSNKNNIHYNFQKYNTAVADKGNLFWAAATAHNSVLEYRDFAMQENIGLPPSHLKIFLSKFALLATHGSGMTPMWNKRWYSGLPQEVALTFFVSNFSGIAGGFVAFAAVLKHEVDMVISYRGPTNDYTSFQSDDLKTTIYHELTHSAHYAALGNSWYSQFVDAEINEVIINLFSANSPYGNGGNSQDSPIIALGESWAYHIGQYLADKQYGILHSSCAGEQGTCYNNGDIAGLSSHLVALENYYPHLADYPFDWIPKGVFYDMIDTRNETSFPVIDNVSGYNNHQFFNAFGSSITSVGDYKENLIQQNPNNQTTQVKNLFQQYGY